ncbi:MAG: DeoR/GlpR family DNA-binding transcription regulator [Thermoguttaceae bacterium]
MPPLERQNAIMDYVDSVGACSYQDLAKLLGVSEMTIRRDVDKLVRQRGLIKTIGGIQTTHAPEHLYESPVQQRLQVNRLEKEQIARVATAEIGPRQTIFLDGSTTCMILARHLAKKMQGLTIVTYSPLVCMEFGRATGNTVFCLGGQFDPISACFAGPATEEEGRRYYVDRAFFSTKGFLPAEGTFESSLGVFRIKQIVAAEAARVILLVDHTKFGQRALCKALDIGQIHEVITDTATTPEDLAALRQRGVTVRFEHAEDLPLEAANHTP